MKVWTCVKVPYTVYRQVEKEVGVKQPCYEKVEVQVTRHVCENCGGLGCHFCQPTAECVTEPVPLPPAPLPPAPLPPPAPEAWMLKFTTAKWPFTDEKTLSWIGGRQMRANGFARRRKRWIVALSALAVWLSLPLFMKPAQALPVFARKYATSCITCHTIYPKLNDVGEAFRRNGYQFPTNEDILVKEEPIKLGTDAYKEMFPNSIWPSTLPSIPPVSIFTITQNVVNVNPHGQLANWSFDFPSDIEIIGAGAFGTDISGFYDLGFTPSSGASVGRVFMQFSNLFTWEEDEDENGCHKGSCWAVLPPHFLNVRVGKIDPAVLPHVISEESFAQFPPFATNTFQLGQTGFALFRSNRPSSSMASTSNTGRTRSGLPTAAAQHFRQWTTTRSKTCISASLAAGTAFPWTA